MLQRGRWIIAIAIVSLAIAGAQAQDPVSPIEIAGPVVSFIAAPGTQFPTLVFDDAELGEVSIRLAPYRVLRDMGFVAQEGHEVVVTAVPCDYCDADYAALEVFNETTQDSFTLRDDDGRPVWARGGRLIVDESAVALASVESDVLTATGQVVGFLGGPGVGTPVLTLDLDGTWTDFRVSPYFAWKTAGWIPEEGQVLTVTYIDVHTAEDVVHLAISVYDPDTGMTLYLRDPETGRPSAPHRFRGEFVIDEGEAGSSQVHRRLMLQRRNQ